MKKYNHISLCMGILLLSCRSAFGAYPNSYLERVTPPATSKKIENGIFIIERFWTSTPNAKELPLLSGPACPCILVFAAMPGRPDVFGIHLHHLNSIQHMIASINSFYKLPAYGEKPKLVFSLFTVTHNLIESVFKFKEETHLNRFQSLLYALDSAYTILNCSYCFDDSPILTSNTDRWVACTGLDEKNKLQVYRFDPIESGTFKSHAHIDNYIFLQYQKTFGIHQMLNILPDNMWQKFDQEVIKMESENNIPIINSLTISPENSIHLLLVYRRKAQEDILYGRDTTRRALAEQKLMNIDY